MLIMKGSKISKKERDSSGEDGWIREYQLLGAAGEPPGILRISIRLSCGILVFFDNFVKSNRVK